MKTLWQREAIIAAVAIGASSLVLPFVVYLVGDSVIGNYSPDGGALLLAEHLWTDLLHLRGAAWLLVASPYIVAQLVRLAWHLSRL